MGLFVVRHQHAAERCPARDPHFGSTLLNHLGRSNLRRYGLNIRGEAIIPGEHSLYLVIEAASEVRLREFLEPFAAAGDLDIRAASTCVRVVASGGCAASLPDDELVDAEEACEQAMGRGLIVRRAHPLNCETPIPELVGGEIMPSTHFYVRNHFQIPTLDAKNYSLSITGLVERPVRLSLSELQAMPYVARLVTLECAGNGRAYLDPPVDGEQWGFGAVSTAEWRGVALAEVLKRVGVCQDATEVLFRGADSGPADCSGTPVHFERSLSLDDATASEAFLAYAMNGESLPIEHGYPVRLIVPGWYAVASVKWLTAIELLGRPFAGHYQAEKYWYEWRDGAPREPVTYQRVRALIVEPEAGREVSCGQVVVRGVAWSGAAPVTQVQVGVNGEWHDARLVGEPKRHSWCAWELIARIEKAGTIGLCARATDDAGNTQPDQSRWNRDGYGGNGIQRMTIRAV